MCALSSDQAEVAGQALTYPYPQYVGKYCFHAGTSTYPPYQKFAVTAYNTFFKRNSKLLN
jgi:hypothetical protein